MQKLNQLHGRDATIVLSLLCSGDRLGTLEATSKDSTLGAVVVVAGDFCTGDLRRASAARRVSLARRIASDSHIPAASVGAAALITALSYLLLTGFDTLGIRYAGRDVPYRRTPSCRSWLRIRHNVGVAAFSGAALRYRLYSSMGLGVVDVATVVGFCSLTTGLGLAAVGGTALLFKPRILSTAANLHPDLVNASYRGASGCGALCFLGALCAGDRSRLKIGRLSRLVRVSSFRNWCWVSRIFGRLCNSLDVAADGLTSDTARI